MTPISYPAISIVVTTLNSSKTIDTCLRSIFDLNYPKEKYEIIIVDGGSTDATLTKVSAYPNIRIIKNILGRGNAYAVGINNAQAGHVAFIDSDAVVFPDFLLKTIPFFSNDHIAYVSGRIHGRPDSSLIQKFADVLQSRSIGSACACVYKKSAVLDVGGFNLALNYYQEDELLKKMKNKGYTSYCVSDFLAFHVPKDALSSHMSTSYVQGYWATTMLFDYSNRSFIKIIISNMAGTFFLMIFLIFILNGILWYISFTFLISVFLFECLYLLNDTWAPLRKIPYLFGAVLLYHLCSLTFSLGVIKKFFKI